MIHSGLLKVIFLLSAWLNILLFILSYFSSSNASTRDHCTQFIDKKLLSSVDSRLAARENGTLIGLSVQNKTSRIQQQLADNQVEEAYLYTCCRPTRSRSSSATSTARCPVPYHAFYFRWIDDANTMTRRGLCQNVSNCRLRMKLKIHSTGKVRFAVASVLLVRAMSVYFYFNLKMMRQSTYSGSQLNIRSGFCRVICMNYLKLFQSLEVSSAKNIGEINIVWKKRWFYLCGCTVLDDKLK